MDTTYHFPAARREEVAAQLEAMAAALREGKPRAGTHIGGTEGFYGHALTFFFHEGRDPKATVNARSAIFGFNGSAPRPERIKTDGGHVYTTRHFRSDTTDGEVVIFSDAAVA